VIYIEMLCKKGYRFAAKLFGIVILDCRFHWFEACSRYTFLHFPIQLFYSSFFSFMRLLHYFSFSFVLCLIMCTYWFVASCTSCAFACASCGGAWECVGLLWRVRMCDGVSCGVCGGVMVCGVWVV
jgi:hypothetical protein